MYDPGAKEKVLFTFSTPPWRKVEDPFCTARSLTCELVFFFILISSSLHLTFPSVLSWTNCMRLLSGGSSSRWQMEEGIEEEEKKRENFSLFSFYASSRARRVVHTWSESSDFFFFVAVFSIPRNNKKNTQPMSCKRRRRWANRHCDNFEFPAFSAAVAIDNFL